MGSELIIFGLSFMIIFLAFFIVSRSRDRSAYQERLADLDHHKKRLETARGEAKPSATGGHAYRGSQSKEGSWGRMIAQLSNKSDEEKQKINMAFEMAGWHLKSPLMAYGLAKLLFLFPSAPFVGLYGYFVAQWELMLLIGAVIGVALLSSYMVDWALRWMVNRRQKKIEKGFPDALDLMVICSEAGLSLNAIISRVAKDIGQIHPELGYEMSILGIELNMLSSRKQAMDNFSARLQSQMCKNMVGSMLQAEQYGTPISQTMRTLAEEFRFDRLMTAEQRAAKLPVLMAGPLVLFIFPSLFVVILGPAIINVMTQMG